VQSDFSQTLMRCDFYEDVVRGQELAQAFEIAPAINDVKAFATGLSKAIICSGETV